MRVTKYNFESNDILTIERKNIYGEDIMIFSTSYNDYQARLISSDNIIVVEHNIPMAESGTFSSRHQAISYIKSLLSLFSSIDFEEALSAGYRSYIEGTDNPYTEDALLNAAWMRGFSMAENYFQKDEPFCLHTVKTV